MIRVLIADDQELIRQSLSFVLDAQADIEMVGTASNGREAIELARKEKPDVVLMDIRMPEVDGVECTRLIKSAYPQIKVIILTTFDDDEYVFGALRYGASGYLLKGVSVKELADAVREVVRGGSIIMPGVASKALEMFARMARGNMQIAVDEKQTADLQENEWRVIREVGCGKSNKEIAAALCLSEGTVRNYLSSVLSKLDLRDRTQLAIWAVQSGVTTDPFGGKPWEG
nr:response regulator transcription factor [uncultured Agathobaculum sp.]